MKLKTYFKSLIYLFSVFLFVSLITGCDKKENTENEKQKTDETAKNNETKKEETQKTSPGKELFYLEIIC
jgi:large-conductance mechanosensitive channel